MEAALPSDRPQSPILSLPSEPLARKTTSPPQREALAEDCNLKTFPQQRKEKVAISAVENDSEGSESIALNNNISEQRKQDKIYSQDDAIDSISTSVRPCAASPLLPQTEGTLGIAEEQRLYIDSKDSEEAVGSPTEPPPEIVDEVDHAKNVSAQLVDSKRYYSPIPSPDGPIHETGHGRKETAPSEKRTMSGMQLSNPQLELCPSCYPLHQQNDILQRKVARLRMRLRKSSETAQTHGQRLLRAAFQEEVREMADEHARSTTGMLNIQQKCFEDELEAMENESRACISNLWKELQDERDSKEHIIRSLQEERDAALAKTNTTMQAVQRKLAQLHARATRFEREKIALSAAQDEKQVMIEVLASAAAAKDVERRRFDLLSKSHEEERNRKNSLIDILQKEVGQMRELLDMERRKNQALTRKAKAMGEQLQELRDQHAEDPGDCKQGSKKENEQLGQLFTSAIQEFSNVQSDVSTND